MEKSSPMPNRMRSAYLSIEEIAPGMTLAKPLAVTEKRILRYMLPEGHQLTEDNIKQLASHHAKAVCVWLADDRTDEEIAASNAEMESKLHRIFAHADRGQPIMAALFNRLCMHLSR